MSVNGEPAPSEVDSIMAATLLAISRADSVSEAVSSPQPSSHRTPLNNKELAASMMLSPTQSSSSIPQEASSWIRMATPERSPHHQGALAFLPIAPSTLSTRQNQQQSLIDSTASPVTPRATATTEFLRFQQERNIQCALQAVSEATSNNNLSILRLFSGDNALNEFQKILQPEATPEQIVASPLRIPSTLAPFPASRGGYPQQVAGGIQGSLNDECLVRKQEIEKALRSQPQRGRKRANLNEVERLELTRTRNREHAKSTRIRKKARYEELVDCEHKLQEHLEKEELDRQRRRCVLDFVFVRDRMLQGIAQSCCSTQDKLETAQELDALVEDPSTLAYQDGASHNGATAADRMKEFDDALVSRAMRSFGIGRAPLHLSYQMNESIDDVAISPSGVSLTQLEILGGPGNGPVLSAFLKLEFARNSAKVRAIAFTTVSDSLDSGGALDPLEVQGSHPSVVSLDRRDVEDSDEKRAESDEGSGPGMNI
jgi:hypothetical protein